MMAISGKVWVFGDNIDTDVLAPGYAMKLPPEKLAQHCLEAVDATFASGVAPGDILVAGKNFGLGSSREQAAVSLKLLGVGAVLATSFARIFYRNAINIGLPVLTVPDAGAFAPGDKLRIDLEQGTISNLTQGADFQTTPVPANLLEMIEAGGLIAQLEHKLASGALKKPAGQAKGAS